MIIIPKLFTYIKIYLKLALEKFSQFLHELSHSHGSGDGEREFSDMLTVLLQNSIEKNSVISKYSKEWSRYKS